MDNNVLLFSIEHKKNKNRIVLIGYIYKEKIVDKFDRFISIVRCLYN